MLDAILVPKIRKMGFKCFLYSGVIFCRQFTSFLEYTRFQMAEPPEEITVRQVVVALEGDMAIVDCQRGAQCKDADKCATHKVWNRISDAVNGALDAITLKDMLNDYSCAQARGD